MPTGAWWLPGKCSLRPPTPAARTALREALHSSATSLHRSSSTQEAEIVPGLYRLAGVRGVNVHLWRPERDTRTEAEPILFDCGYPWSGHEIVASLAVLDYRPAEIRMIAITHADFDHVGRLAPLAAISHAEILAHAMEGPRLESAQWRRLPGHTKGAGGGKWLDPIILIARPLYRLWPPQPTKITRPAQDGEEIGGGWPLSTRQDTPPAIWPSSIPQAAHAHRWRCPGQRAERQRAAAQAHLR